MSIEYKIGTHITSAQFVDLLRRSTLGERRPIDQTDCMQGMLDHCDLLISAWHDNQLVGIARSLTDFHYACYLSDLAVCQSLQKRGIGKQLLKLTQQQLGAYCKLI